MRILLDIESGSTPIIFYVGLGIVFFIGVFITRWIFSIDQIIDNLKEQNKLSLMQIRLLKKMLINQGTPISELDDILENGNNNENEKKAAYDFNSDNYPQAKTAFAAKINDEKGNK